MDHPDVVQVVTTGVANGGAAVARLDDGIVVFVEGALPGETVRVAIDERKRRHARGHVVEVIGPAETRVEPHCPHVADGCGGCDWLHVAPAARAALRERIVADALGRIGRLDDVAVTTDLVGPSDPADRLRTTVRAAVRDGRAGLRRRRTHEPVVHGTCRAAHPLAEELLVEGRYGDAAEVTIRVGARTGERLVVVSPRAEGVAVPSDVIVVGDDELRAGRRAWIHEEVAGRGWRISARSFFQSCPHGADRLVALVAAAVDRAPAGPFADLYCGVGLFVASVGAGRSAVAVERSASAVADARVNTSDHPDVSLVRATVTDWTPSPAAVVVADPSREGLGATGVGAVGATGASRAVLVSCDAGAFGRDARLLVDAGYELVDVTLVDMFTGTSHVEVVSVFDRPDPADR